MRKSYKKLLSMGLAVAVAFTTIISVDFGSNSAVPVTAAGEEDETVPSTNDIVVPDLPLPMRDLTASEITEEMGVGYNLGNTFDAPNETSWQDVVTTKEYIKAVHDWGYNTIRIPVTWSSWINSDYSVQESWMSRVQDVVDYAIEQDMYVIMNTHHDGWLKLIQKEGPALDAVYEKFAGLWQTIAERFKNYDEHLIFADMNEIHEGYDTNEAAEYMDNILKANQLFVDTVRATGSNNATRWLDIVPWNTTIEVVLDEDYGFSMPDDPAEEDSSDGKPRVMLEVHDYDPSNTTLNGTNFAAGNFKLYQSKHYSDLHDLYVANDVPVIVGEYGLANSGREANRIFYYEGINLLMQKYGLIGCNWDNGSETVGTGSDKFGLWDRANAEPAWPRVIQGMVRGYLAYDEDADYTDVIQGTPEDNSEVAEIPALTSFDVSDSELTMTIGDMETVTVSDIVPEDVKNVILWKTADPKIATVYNGNIRARGIGTTTITAIAQDGSAKQEITVTVEPDGEPGQRDEIWTEDLESASIGVAIDGAVFINAESSNPDAFVYYRSADESVATVSSVGKIVGIGEGSTTITIATSTGLTKNITVTVDSAPSSNILKLGLYIRYNDEDKDYFNDERGTVLEVQRDGSFEAVFDCETDLSDEAKAAGITNLENIISVYFKDVDVYNNSISKSIVRSGNISFSSVQVNDTELALKDVASYSIMNAAGTYVDTGRPINVWGTANTVTGSSVETEETTEGQSAVQESEFIVKDNTLTKFAKIDNPTKITVKFTLSDMLRADGSIFEPLPDPTPTVKPKNTPKPTQTPDTEGTPNPTDAVTATKAPDAGTPTTVPTGAPKSTTGTTQTVTKGYKVQISGATYQVTANTASSRTVAYVAAKKNAASVTVPATVTINSQKYKVTSISAKAMKGNKKLKSLVIGASIKTIGKQAFYGCTKLKKITVKSKVLTKVGAKAFAKGAKKVTVTVPKAKAAKYKKLLKKAKLSTKAKYKKK